MKAFRSSALEQIADLIYRVFDAFNSLLQFITLFLGLFQQRPSVIVAGDAKDSIARVAAYGGLLIGRSVWLDLHDFSSDLAAMPAFCCSKHLSLHVEEMNLLRFSP